MTYQPTATHPGERPCVDRYEPICRVLSAFPQPFTVLDLGANTGWFSTRLAADFDCHVTAVDDHPDLAAAASDRVTVDARRVTAQHLAAMPRTDVALALSVLHHMADWRQVLDVLRGCRLVAFVEVPHPSERWMRHAAARHELKALHDAVADVGACIGTSDRTGRDGVTHQRPLYAIPSTVADGPVTITGRVFSGSGTCSRKLTPTLHARGLDRVLGYQPYPGSLNLRCDVDVDLSAPAIDWPGLVRGRSRHYWFWPAWTGGIPCHAMDPAGRGHGPGCIEVVAPVCLRDELGLADGDTLTLEVDRGR